MAIPPYNYAELGFIQNVPMAEQRAFCRIVKMKEIAMLTKFAVKNYRGFKNCIEWDLSHPRIIRSITMPYIMGYSKMASELKGDIISEKITVDNKEILVKDKNELAIPEEFGLTAVAIQNLKDSANNISIVNYLLSSVPLPKDHALLQLRDFVENMLFFRSLDYREFIGLKEGGSNVEEYIIKNNLTDDFAAYLKEVSGQEYEFAPNTQGDNILFCIMNGVRIPFQWVASTGTRNLELQYYWLKEMDNASFVFIDEFDAFYHHELSYKICKRLFEGNPLLSCLQNTIAFVSLPSCV